MATRPSYGSTTTLYNSIGAQNSATTSDNDVYDYGSGTTVDAYNALSSYTSWDNASAADVVNYVYDAEKPLFADAANGDYTLAGEQQG